MQRDLTRLEGATFDLLVIGGGAFGACVVWDAVLRGLKVALVEKSDFSAGASGSCFKMAHGGMRYLQHGDLSRVRSSSADQSALLRIAPHAVKPLPTVVPTYGQGRKGKSLLTAGVASYHLLTAGKNRGITDPSRHIAPGRSMSQTEVLELFPGIDRHRLSGAVMFYDAQIHNPARLALSFLRSAYDRGAVIANHVEVLSYLRNGDRVCGVTAQDCLGDAEFAIHASMVINATGGWADFLNVDAIDHSLRSGSAFSRDAFFMIPRRFGHPYALALPTQTKDPNAVLSRSARHLFLVPWRDRTMIGVWHKVVQNRPDESWLRDDELQTFIDEVQSVYPALELTIADVSNVSCGHVPFGNNPTGASDLSYGKRSLLIDHAKAHGIAGLVTLIGVRYTVARSDAARAVDLVCRHLGHLSKPPATDRIPIYGGDCDNFEALVTEIRATLPQNTPPAAIDALARNHGTGYRSLSRDLQDDGEWRVISDTTVFEAEIAHAVRAEMACTLEDIVYRRTEIGSGGRVSAATMATAAKLCVAAGLEEKRVAKEHAHLTGSGAPASPTT